MASYACGDEVFEQRVTWKCMQSLGTCLRLAEHILKIQLCISIDHRVDSHKLQHRLLGVRSCIRDCCSQSNVPGQRSATCSHMQTHASEELQWL